MVEMSVHVPKSCNNDYVERRTDLRRTGRAGKSYEVSNYLLLVA